MSPIVPGHLNSNTVPASLFGGYLTSTLVLIYLVSHRVLYHAHKAFPPSQAVRHRQGSRRKQLRIYFGLSILSLAVAVYHGYSLVSISYRAWAYERGESRAPHLLGEDSVFSTARPVGIEWGRWLNDTDLLREIWETALQDARRRWWAQQLFLGRRRNIPHLWAFIGLAPLVSLSFAQCLFFLAILWTPVPLSGGNQRQSLISIPAGNSQGKALGKGTRTAQKVVANADALVSRAPRRPAAYVRRYLLPMKPRTWTPHALLYIIPLLMAVVDTLLLTLATDTPSFGTFLRHLLFDLFLPVVLARLSPLRWGKSNSSVTDSQTRALAAFRVAGIFSLLLHLAYTVAAVRDTNVRPYRHRYPLPFLNRDKSGQQYDAARSGPARILDALGDHPAVGRAGWDMILSTLNCCIWAGTRGIDPHKMMRSVGLSSANANKLVDKVAEKVKAETKRLIDSGCSVDEEGHSQTQSKTGRRRKGATTSQSMRTTTSKEDINDDEYGSTVLEYGWYGDEEVAEDWESGALAWGLAVVGGLGFASAGVLGAEVMDDNEPR